VPAAALVNRSHSAVDAPSATVLQNSGPVPVDALKVAGSHSSQCHDLGKARLGLRARRYMARCNQAPGAAGQESLNYALSFPPFVCHNGFFVLGGCSNNQIVANGLRLLFICSFPVACYALRGC
jgi:hypothetical protein